MTSWTLPVRGIEALRWAHANGFEHIQIDEHDVSSPNPQRMLGLSEELGVSLAGLAVSRLETIGVQGPRARDAIDQAIATARSLSIEYVYLPSFGAAEMNGIEDITATAKLLRYSLSVARRIGMTVATENALSADGLSILFELVDDEELDLLFDTQNLCVRGIDPLAVLTCHGWRARKCVHVKDGERGLGNERLGRGQALVADSLDVLRRLKFAGNFILESEFSEGEGSAPFRDYLWLRDRVREW